MTGEETQDVKGMAPNLVLLDLRLSAGGEESAEICKRLKSNEKTRQIPIILLSAEADIKTVCIACGADDYLPKPFDVDTLTAKGKALIRSTNGKFE